MRRLLRFGGLTAACGVLLQVTACLGPDPQFFLTASVVNALVASLVGALVNAALAGLPSGA